MTVTVVSLGQRERVNRTTVTSACAKSSLCWLPAPRVWTAR